MMWLLATILLSAGPQTVRFSGSVLLPDGSPAAGALVTGASWHASTVRAQADVEGRFTFAGEFPGQATITARSADEKLAAHLTIQAQGVRKRAGEPLLLKLAPTRRVEVLVRKDGKLAVGVQVAHSKDEPPRRTDDQGRVVFALPADTKSLYLSAFDPVRGVGGATVLAEEKAELPQSTTIDLQPTTATTFKVVDEFDKPVAGLKVAASCAFAGRCWFQGENFPESHGVTNANGEWVAAWTPAKREIAQAEPVDPAWQHDGSDERPRDGTPGTLHVRRSKRTKGRVVMPLGASPENLLVEAKSYGFRYRGTSSGARVRADGTFELPVVSEHFFTVGIVDEEWTSPRHYGVLFGRSQEPNDLTLNAEYATVVEVRIVAGKDSKPVVGAWIQGGENPSKDWRDESGQKHSCVAGLRQYGYSDEQGVLRFGMGREPISFSVSHGAWWEEVKAKPPRSGPYIVTLRKPFVDKLRVAGKVVPPPAAAGRVELRAAAGDGWDEPAFAVPVAADGSFHVETDKPTVRLLAADRVGKTSATAIIKGEGEPLVLRMIPNGAYGGTAKNSDGDPLPGCAVTLFLDHAKTLYSRTVKADANGKFLFEDVPAETRHWVHLQPVGVTSQYLYHGQAYVERGERHTDAVDVCSETAATKPRRQRSFAELLKIDIKDARIWHAPALVIASGPGKEAEGLVKRLSNDDAYQEAEWLYCYPLQVAAESLAADEAGKKTFAERGWQVPQAGEILLAAVSGDGKTLGHVLLKGADAEAAKKATTFLVKHAPSKTAALAAVESVIAEARKSDRRILFQLGGLRCGPCYRFARWIDQHRGELEKDFLVLKLSNLHADWATPIERLGLKPAPGIPWTAVLDANGKILATSDGPLGNIGFPYDRQGKKHFRKMLDAGAKRLTPQERDALIASLPSE